jgi:multisubunit Na+/H+ antiporter MnhB subunit
MADEISVSKFADLSRRDYFLLISACVLRILIGFAVIWFVLSLVPQTPGVGLAGPILMIIACAAIYVWNFRRQLKKIKRSKFPQLAAVEALILIAAMFLAVFAAIYVMESTAVPSAFSEDLDHFNAYYFALTILATVGFGDITPVSNVARATAMVQMAIDIAFIAVLVRIISSVATNTIKARSGGSSAGGTSTD